MVINRMKLLWGRLNRHYNNYFEIILIIGFRQVNFIYLSKEFMEIWRHYLVIDFIKHVFYFYWSIINERQQHLELDHTSLNLIFKNLYLLND